MGFSVEKVLVILVIAALLIGPERLPRAAEALAGLVRKIRVYANDTKTRLKEEMGEDFEDIDWHDLDPRQYDPRRIIREALTEPLDPSADAHHTVPKKPASVNRNMTGQSIALDPVGRPSDAGSEDFDDAPDDAPDGAPAAAGSAEATAAPAPVRFDDEAT